MQNDFIAEIISYNELIKDVKNNMLDAKEHKHIFKSFKKVFKSKRDRQKAKNIKNIVLSTKKEYEGVFKTNLEASKYLNELFEYQNNNNNIAMVA